MEIGRTKLVARRRTAFLAALVLALLLGVEQRGVHARLISVLEPRAVADCLRQGRGVPAKHHDIPDCALCFYADEAAPPQSVAGEARSVAPTDARHAWRSFAAETFAPAAPAANRARASP